MASAPPHDVFDKDVSPHDFFKKRYVRSVINLLLLCHAK
jgi:hypothetical protein